MPKKKLTKAQVKRKLKACSNAMYDLFLDKLGHGATSFAPMSKDKLGDMYATLQTASRRVK